jgi:hypothetical protein
MRVRNPEAWVYVHPCGNSPFSRRNFRNWLNVSVFKKNMLDWKWRLTYNVRGLTRMRSKEVRGHGQLHSTSQRSLWRTFWNSVNKEAPLLLWIYKNYFMLRGVPIYGIRWTVGVRIRRPIFIPSCSLCTEILRILFRSNSHMYRILVSCFVRVRNEVSMREYLKTKCTWKYSDLRRVEILPNKLRDLH